MTKSPPVTNRNRLRELRLKSGMTQGQLGALVGTSAQQIHKLEHAHRRMDVIWAAKLARALGVRPSDVAGFEDAIGLSDSARDLIAPPVRGISPPLATPIPFFGPQIPAGAGEMILPDAPESDLPCPPALQGVQGAYLLTVSDNHMAPRYREGEVLYVHPHRTPRPGQYVVLRRPGNRVHLGELVRTSSDSVTFRRLTPPSEATFPRRHLIALHLIVGSFDP